MSKTLNYVDVYTRLGTLATTKRAITVRGAGVVSILKCLNERTNKGYYANQSDFAYCRFLFGKLKK